RRWWNGRLPRPAMPNRSRRVTRPYRRRCSRAGAMWWTARSSRSGDAMPRRKTMQTNFSAGEIAPDVAQRQDTEQYQSGAKSLRNRRCLIGGGTKRRPGLSRLSELLQRSRGESFIVNAATQYVLVFSSGRVYAFVQDVETKQLSPAGSLAGQPWTGDIWKQMDYEQSGNTAFLTHPSMLMQRLVRTGAASWTCAPFAFFVGHGGRIEQPYLKLA